MAVPEQTPYKEYIANGSTSSFSLGFLCDSKDQLIVLVDDIAPPVASWSFNGSSVVFNSPPEAGKKIAIQRNTKLRRTGNFQNYDNSFRPETINKELDWIWLKLQELGVVDLLLRLYVERLHNEQKNYIDQKDALLQINIDNLLTYILDQIRQQGVALAQLDKFYDYLMTRISKIATEKGWEATFVVDKSGRTQQEINNALADVRSYGAVGDGVLHTVEEWTQLGSRKYYPNLAAIQSDYPHVTSLSDSIDWAATQQAVNTPHLYKLRFPCVTGLGRYDFGSNELVIPNTKSNLTFVGDGTADAGATVIYSTPNKSNFIAIHSKAYATTLQDMAILSTTGNDDGFGAIGFLHMRTNTGSTGRLCHRNLRIQGFSKHACKIGQAINYQFDNITFTGGVETLWIGHDASINQRSTTVSMYHAYITGGKRCGVYLDRPSDFMADRLIIESCGKGINPLTGTYYEDAAGLINQGTGQCQLNAPYFEDNRRNIYSDAAIITIAPNYGPATLPNEWAYNPASADESKGRVEILRNGVRLRFLRADEFKGYIEVPDQIRFASEARFNSDLIAKSLFVGSQQNTGRVDGEVNAYISSNMSGTSNLNVRGQFLNFGITNSSAGSSSQWMQLGHRRTANSGASALDLCTNTGVTNYKPDGTPYVLMTFDSAKKVHPGVDNEVSLGIASNRWKDVYASTGTIQTSDERLKQQFRTQTEAEKAAALEIKDSICFFKFNEAVEIKDDGARWHCGVKAQQVVTILKNHGLDPFSYAFVCYDEWEEVQASILTEYTYLASKIDENGWEYLEPVTEMVETGEVETLREAGNRYSIRYDELMMFILRAIL